MPNVASSTARPPSVDAASGARGAGPAKPQKPLLERPMHFGTFSPYTARVSDPGARRAFWFDRPPSYAFEHHAPRRGLVVSLAGITPGHRLELRGADGKWRALPVDTSAASDAGTGPGAWGKGNFSFAISIDEAKDAGISPTGFHGWYALRQVDPKTGAASDAAACQIEKVPNVGGSVSFERTFFSRAFGAMPSERYTYRSDVPLDP